MIPEVACKLGIPHTKHKYGKWDSHEQDYFLAFCPGVDRDSD